MAGIAVKFITKRILGESLENNFGKSDPYFETVPASRLDGKPSSTKTKKRRKALPPGLSEHDGKVLTKVKRRAYRLDMSLFNCCGIAFGWSSVIGIIPGVGDVIDALMAIMVLKTCMQVEGGLPADVKSKMTFNIILDFAVGLVPILGDVADALFRANTRNAVVLEEHLRKKGAKNLRLSGQPLPAFDPSDPMEFDRQDNNPPPRYAEVPPNTNGYQPQAGSSRRPVPATPVHQPSPQQTGGGWFSFGRKSKPADLEHGGAQRREADTTRASDDSALKNKSNLQKNRPV